MRQLGLLSLTLLAIMIAFSIACDDGVENCQNECEDDVSNCMDECLETATQGMCDSHCDGELDSCKDDCEEDHGCG